MHPWRHIAAGAGCASRCAYAVPKDDLYTSLSFITFGFAVSGDRRRNRLRGRFSQGHCLCHASFLRPHFYRAGLAPGPWVESFNDVTCDIDSARLCERNDGKNEQ